MFRALGQHVGEGETKPFTNTVFLKLFNIRFWREKIIVLQVLRQIAYLIEDSELISDERKARGVIKAAQVIEFYAEVSTSA